MQDTPLTRYLADLQRPDFEADESQKVAVDHLQRLFDELVQAPERKQGLLGRLGLVKGKPQKPIQGVYFWGGVGRGKTYLVDTFYDCLPFEEKMRMHFHRFMAKVHTQRRQLVDKQDPLKIIAERLAQETRILCFDEFVVNDVADAVILVKLLQGLFDQGVSLVATSNVEPINLYKGGLQRDLFLPAIALIQQHCEVVNLDSGIDYRLRFLDKAEIYFTPDNDAAEEGMQYNFEHLAPDAGTMNGGIEVEGRELAYLRRADGVIWFKFGELCDGPRSQNDYIELARCFHSVLISHIPILDKLKEDQARRFINLVDVFYDHNVKLIVSAEANPQQLYVGTKVAFEFERTISRLQEMQSHDYLALEHRA